MGRDQNDLVTIGKRGRAAKDEDPCVPRKTKRRPLDALLPVLKALADENRLAIVEILMGAEGQICACDIEGAMGLAQATVSHHMRVLRDAGLVEGERRGQWVYYSATDVAVRAVEALLVAGRG